MGRPFPEGLLSRQRRKKIIRKDGKASGKVPRDIQQIQEIKERTEECLRLFHIMTLPAANSVFAPLPPANAPKLGLVCITQSDAVRFRTVTRTRLLSFPPEEQAAILREIYGDNIARLTRAVDFCLECGIRLYRMSSALFPSADTPEGAAVLAEFDAALWAIGTVAREGDLRIIAHPEQFIVLNSDTPAIIENSLRNLEYHAGVLDRLSLPRSNWAAMIIHGGKSGRSERLIETIAALPLSVKSRLVLENDEHAYSATDILTVCHAAKVPMVFDAHHHICREKLDSYDHPSVTEMFFAARATWQHPEEQIVHISNGREHFNDTRHSEYITQMPSIYALAPYIEVEAKAKEAAIAALQTQEIGFSSSAAGKFRAGEQKRVRG